MVGGDIMVVVDIIIVRDDTFHLEKTICHRSIHQFCNISTTQGGLRCLPLSNRKHLVRRSSSPSLNLPTSVSRSVSIQSMVQIWTKQKLFVSILALTDSLTPTFRLFNVSSLFRSNSHAYVMSFVYRVIN